MEKQLSVRKRGLYLPGFIEESSPFTNIAFLNHDTTMNRTIRSLLSTNPLSVCAKRYKYSKIKPVLDLKYLLDPENRTEIAENTVLRKGVGDIHRVHEILAQSSQENPEVDSLLLKIPNKTHPDVKSLGDEPKIIKYFNEKPKFDFKPHQFQEIANKNKWFRMEHLSNFTGHKSYYLMGDLAALVGANSHTLILYL